MLLLPQAMRQNDTIVACATPVGYSSIGVIRMSGPSVIEIIKQTFFSNDTLKEFEPNHIYYGKIVEPKDKKIIDEVLLSIFRKPHSYTGDDVVEISCHGNPLIIDRIIKIFILLGARMARRGEFTRRALLNDKIDLLQAEAVQDIVFATCDEARKIALNQLEGRLSEVIYNLRSKIIDILTELEANINFPEEEGIGYDFHVMKTDVENAILKIDSLLADAAVGRKIREGYRLVTVGRGNVGKSTLFNRLVGYERVIVHEKPGTTRDYIEEGIELEGLYLRLYDTAGILKDSKGLDTIAAQRALNLLNDADFLLLMFDGSEPMNEQDVNLYNLTKGKDKVTIVNKIDLNIILDNNEILSDSIKISAKTGKNIDFLKQAIKDKIKSNSPSRNILITRNRHIQALKDIKKYLVNFLHTNKIDTAVFELHAALDVVGELTGKVTRKEILDRIFQEFCVGK